MKKLLVFIFLLFLFEGCYKEEWHEDRLVGFPFDYNISFNQNDGVLSQIDYRIEYKIIGDPNADTSTKNVVEFTYEEVQGGGYNYNCRCYHSNHRLMSFDHLEFKVTTSSSNVKPTNLEFTLSATTDFYNYNIPAHSNRNNFRRISEHLLTINSPDTTIYFTWSPPNFD